MGLNLIARALSERLLSAAEDVLPWLNREGIPILRDIRTALNDAGQVTLHSGAGGTETLPDASLTGGSLLGRVRVFINTGTGNLTIAAAAGQTVNSAASISLTFPAVAILVSDGVSSWVSLGASFKATKLTTTAGLDVTGTATMRNLTVYPGAVSGSPVTVQLLGDLRQMVFGTSNAVIVGNQSIGGGLMIGSTAGEKVGLHGATPTAQLAAITAPTGGATIDAEARTAINDIRDRLTVKGITA